MDPERIHWDEPWEDDSIQNFFMGVVALVVVIAIVVLAWKCCTDDDKVYNPIQTIPSQKYPVTPVFAHELEPGLVVLQSQDGEFFRILQEYDARKNSKPDQQRSGACAYQPDAQTDTSALQYIPHYTRAHYQNHPSAPAVPPETLIDFEIQETPTVPPPYSKY